jgi:hypothetical protein
MQAVVRPLIIDSMITMLAGIKVVVVVVVAAAVIVFVPGSL